MDTCQMPESNPTFFFLALVYFPQELFWPEISSQNQIHFLPQKLTTPSQMAASFWYGGK